MNGSRTIFLSLTVVLILLLACTGHGGNWLQLGIANDVIFQTDRNFSNGLVLKYARSDDLSFLNALHFLNRKKQTVLHTLSLRQNIYTPDRFSTDHRIKTDRPFAAYLVMESEKTTFYKSSVLLLTSKFEGGVIGKYAGGDIVQNSVHDLLPTSAHVDGWENQVRSDFVANLGIKVEKIIYGTDDLGVSSHIEAELGLPFTRASAGLTLWSGDYKDYFYDFGFSLSHDWRIYLFATFHANLVLYNATIQGGVINSHDAEAYPAINHMVFGAKTGMNLAFKGMILEIGIHNISPEFKSGTSHHWGYLAVSFNIGR